MPNLVLPLTVARALACCALLLTACGPPAGPDADLAAAGGPELPALAALADGWNMLRPGGDTICAQGTEYAFFARRARTDRVLLYLQGGGACWNMDTCDPDGQPTYSRDVDETDDPGRRPVGIFDLDNPENPIADYSMVMVPYCTGDVHVGNRQMTYVDMEFGGGKRVTVNHRGWVNGQAVVRWLFDNFEAPAEVVVAGTSAGSIPTPLYAQLVSQHWPEARVVALSDASGAYRREATPDAPMFEMWGTDEALRQVPGYETASADTLTFKDFYVIAAAQRPTLQLRRYDAANDQAQAFYLRKAGTPEPDVLGLLRSEASDLSAQVPGFRRYIAGGPVHGILFGRWFYTYEVAGVRFRDWFTAAVAGDDLADVECVDCSRPELHAGEQDAAVLERAAALLAEEAAWNRQDDRDCRDDMDAGRYSLRCAVQAAGQQGSGNGAAIDGVRFAVLAIRNADADTVLIEFNNDPATTHEQVLAMLATAAADLRGHTHD